MGQLGQRFLLAQISFQDYLVLKVFCIYHISEQIQSFKNVTNLSMEKYVTYTWLYFYSLN